MNHFAQFRIIPTLLLALTLSACGDNSGPTGSIEIVCGEGATGALAAGGSFEVGGAAAADLSGAAIAASAATTAPTAPVSIQCADDIVPPGFIALGPAVSFGPAGAWSDRPFDLTLPYKAARLPETATGRHVRIVAKRHIGDGTPFFPPVANRFLDDSDPYASLARFRAGELVTYQVVALADAGVPEARRFTYRAIIGISMGGNASLSIAMRNHERFDLIGDLGGEPGPSMKYSMGMIRDFLFGGFCTATDEANGTGNVGELCTSSRRPLYADQFEIGSDFEHMVYQSGDGVGLTLKRNLYMKASRDLARALGNPALYNLDDPYLPPGVDWTYANRTAADRCANPLVLADFFDAEFNPTAAHPVITFCDGGDSTDLGLGVFDPAKEQLNPAEILLAVDVNGNGVRDQGEPVVTNAYEPFEDIGADGVADKDETGALGPFDATTNPDPAGDNYHYLRNPRGTEGNFHHDEGEPYQDIGLDGVAGSCQMGTTPPTGVADCYDFGEGDGKWNLSPNVERWYQSDLSVLYAQMTEAERTRINLWGDAGIRDFLNAVVSANVGFGSLMGEFGLEGAVFDGFGALNEQTNDARFDFATVDWSQWPRNGYVRYGDPDATETQINNGDGRHVGTASQLINRATTAFAWINAQWPNGDRNADLGGGQILDNLTFTPPTTQRETPYALFLPPGYEDPANADLRYPVVFFLHGYGQDPNDLVLVSAVFENYMTNPSWDAEDRFQKMIIVYVDGRCRPNKDGVPVDPTGDLCEGGTFYMDAPGGGPAQMETNMLELMDYIDANYRTKMPETVMVPK